MSTKRLKFYYQDVASSNAKRTPPTGARNAAATPAAAPQVTRSLLSLSFFKYVIHLHVNRYCLEPPCPKSDAKQAPICTIGPSFPTSKPPATAQMLPSTYRKIFPKCHNMILFTTIYIYHSKSLNTKQNNNWWRC